MKRESLLWLLTVAAGAAPLLQYEQGSQFDYPGLRFGQDRKFSITMFNDMHLGDGDKPDYYDDKTIDVMNSVLDHEHNTDLVVLNGDLTSCEWLSQDQAILRVDKILTPLIDRNLPFTTTFGNHDWSTTCDPRQISQHIWDTGNKNGRQLTWTTSSVQGDPNTVGSSNYYIPVYSSSGGGNPELKLILWFFDSRGGKGYHPGGDGIQQDDWVDEKVVAWFRLTRDQIWNDHGRKTTQSMVFVHIPPSVTRNFQQSGDLSSSTEPGLNEETIAHQANSGGGNDTPFMQALAETNGLIGVFSGHDHSIDWCMKWSNTKAVPGNDPGTSKGVNLCFGRHTGYGGYSDWMRGGRRIIVDEDKLGQDNLLETWNRLEDGSVSGRVTLNSTYGQDQYPEVEKIKSWADITDDSSEVDSASSQPTTTTSTNNDTHA